MGSTSSIAWAVVCCGGIFCSRTSVLAAWEFPQETREPSIFVPGIPEPITSNEIGRWSRMMRLDDAQVMVFNKLYETYNQSEPALRSLHLDQIGAQARTIAAAGVPALDLDNAAATVQLMDVEAPRAVEKYLAVERDLFNSVVALLRDDQLVGFQLVQHQRSRSCWTRFNGRFPGANIDLTILLDDLLIEGVDVAPQDDELFASLLISYDSTLTQLVRQRGERIVDTMTKGTELQSQLLAGLLYKPDANAAINHLRKRALLVEQRIHDINVQAIANLDSVLPKETGRELLTRFRLMCYQPVYPDPTDIEQMLSTALDLDDLADAERDGIEAIILDSTQRRESICEQMVRHYCEWRAYDSANISTPGSVIEAYAAVMREMHAQRIAIAENAMRTIQEILGPARSEPIDKPFEEARKRMAEFKFRADWRRNV